MGIAKLKSINYFSCIIFNLYKKVLKLRTDIMRYFLLLLAASFILSSCKKSDSSVPKETLQEKLQKDANYNSGITPGVGNVFYEETLIPNSSSHLIFKLGFNGDTLAGYGKINSSGQVQYINSTILSTKGNSELLVTELFPEVSKSRMYTIINNVKSNIVMEIEHFSKTKLTLSILDMDWTTGDAKVLKSTLFVDYKPTSDFSSLRIKEGDKVYNCLDPQPSSDLDKSVDDLLNYFVCGGPAFDSHPTLELLKNAFTGYVDNVNQDPQYVDDKQELDLLKKSYQYFNDLFSKIKNKVGGYKFENSRLAGYLKDLEKKINELEAQKKPEVSLVPLSSLTDTDFDELTDKEIKIGFTLVEKSTGKIYTSFPVFIDMSYAIPGTDTEVAFDTESQGSDGLVLFKLNPTTLPNYESLTSLKATYSYSKDQGSPNASKDISLKFIKPKVVFASGASLPGTVKFTNSQSQSFKLVNEDDRDLLVNYEDVTLNKPVDKIGYTMSKGSNSFSLSLTTNESTEQLTQFDVIYKQKKIATINASLLNEPSSLTSVSGSGQTAASSTTLPNPLIVVVKNNLGNPMPGVNVTWTVNGGGQLTSIVNPTDQNGQSRATWKLGSSGTQTAIATLKKSNGNNVSGSPVTFTAAVKIDTMALLRSKTWIMSGANILSVDGFTCNGVLYQSVLQSAVLTFGLSNGNSVYTSALTGIVRVYTGTTPCSSESNTTISYGGKVDVSLPGLFLNGSGNTSMRPLWNSTIVSIDESKLVLNSAWYTGQLIFSAQ